MRTFLSETVRFGLTAGVLATLLGCLAPWIPAVEMVNHFRPFFLAGATVLVVAALGLGEWWLAVKSGLLALGTLVLMLLPLIHAAPQIADAKPFVRIATINLHGRHADPEALVAFLAKENPDIVLLQEVEHGIYGAALVRLKDMYPHVLSCSTCEQALLSRRPWIESETINHDGRAPLMLRARFEHDGLAYDVYGVHLAFPFTPARQARHVDWLIQRLQGLPGPMIVAGDFNLTPFSWRLDRIARETGLARAATWIGSWPAFLPFGVFLLDNVFTSAEFVPADLRIGPRFGSDHLPLVADIAASKVARD